MATFEGNMDQLEMMRTPFKAKNQDFTPAKGKLQRFNNSNLFVTPTKRTIPSRTTKLITTNPVFKKAGLTPSLKVPLKTKTFNIYNEASTPGSKFSVYQNTQDEILKEMKQKNFKMEAVEKCPWGDSQPCDDEMPSTTPNVPPVRLIEDYVWPGCKLRKLEPIILEPLPAANTPRTITLAPLAPVPDVWEETELCPWATSDESDQDVTLSNVELELSALSDVRATLGELSRISIQCLDDSIRTLEYSMLEDELPDIPTTPELDQELSELLELSFDSFSL